LTNASDTPAEAFERSPLGVEEVQRADVHHHPANDAARVVDCLLEQQSNVSGIDTGLTRMGLRGVPPRFLHLRYCGL
jgi:hypothetical protein